MITLTNGQTIRLSTMAQPSIHHAIKVDFLAILLKLDCGYKVIERGSPKRWCGPANHLFTISLCFFSSRFYAIG